MIQVGEFMGEDWLGVESVGTHSSNAVGEEWHSRRCRRGASESVEGGLSEGVRDGGAWQEVRSRGMRHEFVREMNGLSGR